MSDWLRDRMLGYYPEVVKQLYEIQAIVDGEHPEFRLLTDEQIAAVQNNAYLVTMDETRTKQWEELLNLQVVPGSTIEDRRDAVIARIRGNGKLNTQSILDIVTTFTGAGSEVESRVKNSTLYVKIYPPKDNKEYIFENVKKELEKRKPAHLGLDVKRAYSVWHNIKIEFSSWKDVKSQFNTWEDVLLYVTKNRLNWKKVLSMFRRWNTISNDFSSWMDLYYHKD